MPLFRALAKNMAPMTNADESPTNRLTLFPIYLSLFIVSTLCFGQGLFNHKPDASCLNRLGATSRSQLDGKLLSTTCVKSVVSLVM